MQYLFSNKAEYSNPALALFTLFLVIAFSVLLVGSDSSPPPSTPEVTSVQVTNDVSQLPENTTGDQLRAIAYFDNGASSDITLISEWKSNNKNIAYIIIENNQLTLYAVSSGSALITSTYQGVEGKFELTVTEELLTSIQITPAKKNIAAGYTQQYKAIGTFDNHVSHPITNQVIWDTNKPEFSMINGKGLATGLIRGESEITAKMSGLESNKAELAISDAVLEKIEISSEKNIIPKDTSMQLVATAFFSNDTQNNDPHIFNWRSQHTSVASIDENGILTANKEGPVDVYAYDTDSNIRSNTLPITVNHAFLEKVEIKATKNDIAKGTVIKLTAEATFSDQSTLDVSEFKQTHWQSNDIQVASVSLSGEVKGIDIGYSQITTMLQGIQSEPITIDVSSAEAKSIEITPANMIISSGNTVSYTAEATFTDETKQDVTGYRQLSWTGNNIDAATIGLTGGVTGVRGNNSGPIYVNAYLNNNITGQQAFVVTSCPILDETDLEYTCPLTRSEADNSKTAYDGIHQNQNDIWYATMYWEVANSYCNNLLLNNYSDWRLPTTPELEALKVHYIDGDGLSIGYPDFWPIHQFYHTSSNSDGIESQHDSYYLSLGTWGSQADSKAFVSCVRNKTKWLYFDSLHEIL